MSLLMVLLGGCSAELGAGTIDQIVYDQPIDPSVMSPPMSLDGETDFLTADESTWFDDQYGSKLGAVTAIDVQVVALDITDTNGVPVAGAVFILSFEGVTIDHVGQRVRLPDATKQKVLSAVKQRTALTVPVSVTLSWAMPPPPAMVAHLVLQPIVIVDELKAL